MGNTLKENLNYLIKEGFTFEKEIIITGSNIFIKRMNIMAKINNHGLPKNYDNQEVFFSYLDNNR